MGRPQPSLRFISTAGKLKSSKHLAHVKRSVSAAIPKIYRRVSAQNQKGPDLVRPPVSLLSSYSSRCLLYSQYSGPARFSGQSSMWRSPRQALSAWSSSSPSCHGGSPPRSHGRSSCWLIEVLHTAWRRTMRHHTPNAGLGCPVLTFGGKVASRGPVPPLGHITRCRPSIAHPPGLQFRRFRNSGRGAVR